MGMQSGKTIATDVDVKHWMTSLHSVVGTLKLHELKIPSTQHSGLIECDDQQDEGIKSGSTGSPWGFQIEAGIRALDLRIYQNEQGHWLFHYNNLPSEHSVQSLIDWCNAYYSAPEPLINNEIIVFHIHDCFSPMDQFNDTQLRDLFVKGLRSTSLIPRRAALLNLIQIHQNYPGKNIVLSWDRCVDDDLIWPYRWQGWIKADVPARIEHTATLPLFLICNAVTECISTLVVANSSPPAITAGQPGGSSELDHGLIQACISANLDRAPPAPPVVETSQYDFALQRLTLTITPGFNTSHYQISINSGSNIIYPHTLSEGRHRVTVSLALNRIYQLSIKRIDAQGRTSNGTLVGIDTSTAQDTDNPGNSDGPDGPWIVEATRNGDIAGYAYWGTHDLSPYDHALIKIYRSQDINEGIATGPAIFEKTLNNSATSVTFYPLEVGTDYVVTLVGVFSNLTKTKASWKKVS